MPNHNYLSVLILLFVFFSGKLLAYSDISGNISGQTLNAGATYHVTGDLQVDDNTTTVIDSGAILKFDPGVQIIVYGTLTVNGKNTAWVILTSVDDDFYGEIISSSDAVPEPGDWDGIYMDGQNPPYLDYEGVGNFTYCRIRFGGNSNGSAKANITYSNTASGFFNNSINEFSANYGLKISNSTFNIEQSIVRQNTFDGLNTTNSSTLTMSGTQVLNNMEDGLYVNSSTVTLSDNDFSDNGGYGAHLTSATIKGISGSSGSGNGINGIGLAGSVTVNQTWLQNDVDFPVILVGTVTVLDDISLTIPGPMVIKADSTGRLTVQGYLHVTGISPDSMVVFTSLHDDTYGGDTNGDAGATTPSRGAWQGIYIDSQNPPYLNWEGVGNFDYALLRYGGDVSGSVLGNLTYVSTATGHFNNSTSEFSASHGIRLSNSSVSFNQSIVRENAYDGLNTTSSSTLTMSGTQVLNNVEDGLYFNSSTVTLSNNDFSDNGGYGAYLTAATIKGVSGSSGSGNGINGIGLTGSVTVNQTWLQNDVDFPVILLGTVTVLDDISLTIPGPMVIKADSTGRLTVQGNLYATGISPDSMVVFTSLHDDTYGGDTNGDAGATTPSGGAWQGIYIDSQNPPYLNWEGLGNFDYALLRYGGDVSGSVLGNLTYVNTATGHFSNSTSEFSASHGIRLSNSSVSFNQSIVRENAFDGLNTTNSSTLTMSGTQVVNNVEDGLYFNSSTVTLSNNDFSDNGGYGAYLTAATIKGVSGSSGSGNGINGIGLAGSVTVNQTWLQNDVDFPVILLGTVTVLDDISLTIPGPMVIKADSTGRLTVQGYLHVTGISPDSMVVFTSLHDDTYGGDTNGDAGATTPSRGAWQGIYIDSQNPPYLNWEGVGNFDYALLRYGGDVSGSVLGNLTYVSTATGHFNNSTSELSASHGIRLNNSSVSFDQSIVRQNAYDGLNTSNSSTLTMSGTQVVNNVEDGLYFTSSTVTLSGNDFSDNGGYGAYLTAATIKGVSGSSGSGNGINGIGLAGSVTVNQTWLQNDVDFPVILLSTVTVMDNISLTIPGPMVIKADSAGRLTVQGYLHVTGISPDSMVVFTSLHDDTYGGDTNGDASATTPSAGAWQGIYIDSYNPPYLNWEGVGNFDYALLRYGGDVTGSVLGNLTYVRTATGHFNNSISEFSASHGIRLDNSSVSFNQSIVRQNAFDGLNTTNSSTLTMSGTQVVNNVEDGLYFTSSTVTLSGNDFSDNGGYGAYLTAATIKGVSGSSGSGNGINGIGLAGSVTVNQTWLQNDVDFPVILLGTVTVMDNISLTIPGPMVIKADSTGRLTVQGYLHVTGISPDSMVVFTSLHDDEYGGDTNGDAGATTPSAGAWQGIYIDSYNPPYQNWEGVGNFDYALLRYGGDASGSVLGNLTYVITATGHFNNSTSEFSASHGIRLNNSSVSFDQSIIRQNAYDGLNTTSSSTLTMSGTQVLNNVEDGLYFNSSTVTLSGNDFSDNGGYGAYLTAATIKGVSGSSGSGNGINGIGLAGSVTVNQTWLQNDVDFPVILLGNVTVMDNISLTIPGPMVIKADSAGQLTVQGTLNINGSRRDQMVVFTSINDDEYAGNTDGGSSSPFPGSWLGIYIDSYNPPYQNWEGVGKFNFCRVRYAGNPAGSPAANIRYVRGGTGYVKHSIIEYSASSGIWYTDSSPSARDSRFSNNDSYGILISGNSSPNLGSSSASDKGNNSIKNNNNGEFQLRNESGSVVNAYYNFWQIADSAQIDSSIIYDNDENSAYGTVYFAPWLNLDPSINYPPEITPVPPLQWNEDDTLFVNKSDWYPYVSDPNEPDSVLSFYLIPGTHLQWEKEDSIFKLSAQTDFFGTDSFKLVVVDWEYSDTTILYVSVNPVNDAPAFIGLPNIAFNEDHGFIFDMDDYMVDVDTDTAAVVLASEVINVVSKVGNTDLTIAIDSLSHEVTLSSTMDSSGVFSVVFTATDDSNAVTADTILISVNPVNDPPVVIAGIDDIHLFEDSGITPLVSDLNSVFYDIEDGLNFSALAPVELGIFVRNDSLMVNSEKDFFGLSDVIVIATDSSGASVRDTFNLTIENINDLPEAFHLLTPASGDTLDSLSVVIFSWHPSFDADYDSLDYELHLFVVETESIFLSTKDTTIVFNGEDVLNPDADYNWFVLAFDDSGFVSSTDTLVFHTPKATSIGKDITGIPEIFDLQQNYPNPFNPKTRFRYDLPQAADVKIELYNIMGQRVLTLVDEKKPAGYHFVDLEANSLASGIYFYVIRTRQNFKVRKMILIK